MRRTRSGDLCKVFAGRERATHQQIAGCVHAPIQIDGREYGLECVHEKALLGAAAGCFLAAAQLQVAAEIEIVRDGEQMGGADEVILQQGKPAFGETLEAHEERFADQQSQDRVPQELEALVISLRFFGLNSPGLRPRRLRLVGTGTVRNGTGQQSAVRKAIAEGALEFFQIGLQLLCGRGRRAFCLYGAHSVRLRDALDLGRGVV